MLEEGLFWSAASMEGVGELKTWIKAFGKKEGRKPQAADMPDDIRELHAHL